MASNMSSNPPAREIVIGDFLYSKSSYYQVQSILGQGTFGRVAKCARIRDKKTVAIKMMKNCDRNVRMATEEVATLKKLKSLDPDNCNLVQWYQDFTCKGHICLMFEHLDKSLYDFMKERHFQPLPLKEIRPIVQQLANALHHLKTVGTIHSDIKLENVMLVNHAQEPFRLKVIDFGLACNVSDAKQGSCVQTRPYRAPEIMLRLPFTEAIDMWSVGCLAASLYTGTLLYPGSNEYDMMRYIVDIQGQPPDNMLDLAPNAGYFFKSVPDPTTGNSRYELKTPAEFKAATRIQPKESRKMKLSSLFDLLRIHTITAENSADKAAEKVDRMVFVYLLFGMLQIDPDKRVTPLQVLEHMFITMRHLENRQSKSSHVKSCFEIMEAFQKKTSTSGTQSSSSGSSQNIQQNLPPPSAERSGETKPHDINPLPCTSTQATSSVKSRMKRKVEDEDETLHLSKRVKSEWQRESNAGPSTSSNSLNLTKYNQASTAAPEPCNSSQSQSFTRPGMKRKADDGDEGHRQMDSDCNIVSQDDKKRFRKSDGSPSTSSSNRPAQNYISPKVKRKIVHEPDSAPSQDSKRARKSSSGAGSQADLRDGNKERAATTSLSHTLPPGSSSKSGL